MISNSHQPTPNLQGTEDCPADKGWQNIATEVDEKFKSAGHHMLTAANEAVSDHTERIIEANLEAEEIDLIKENMKNVEGELYKLMDENINIGDRKLKRVEMISQKNFKEGVSWVVANGQRKKLEQAFRDDSEDDVHSDAIRRIKEVGQGVRVPERPVGKAVYHLFPKINAPSESIDFTSTMITDDRMKLPLLSALPYNTPYLVNDLSTISLNNGLLIASNCGDQKRVSELLLKGANQNVRCSHGYMPLHLAAKKGHVNILNILLEYGADVNGQKAKEFTPLHWAAMEGSAACVALLIRAGADVNRKTVNDWTALHFACAADYEDIVQLLLKAGADRSVKNSCGKTPFDLVISKRVKKLFCDTEHGFSLYCYILGVFCRL